MFCLVLRTTTGGGRRRSEDDDNDNDNDLQVSGSGLGSAGSGGSGRGEVVVPVPLRSRFEGIDVTRGVSQGGGQRKQECGFWDVGCKLGRFIQEGTTFFGQKPPSFVPEPLRVPLRGRRAIRMNLMMA